MSKQSLTWLNTMTLIGFTDKRGHAWHNRRTLQGAEPNHYPGAIPLDDIKRRLLFWEPVEGDVSTTILTDNGVVTLTDPSRKTIARLPGTFGPDDPGGIYYVPKTGFQIHHYWPWCVQSIGEVLDTSMSELAVGSAGLLDDGARFWCQVEMPENIETPQGVTHRPFLSAATAVDGSLSSTFVSGSQLIICDNTLQIAHQETGAGKFKVKHSRNSLGRLGEIRDALGIVHRVAEEFEAELARLCAIDVSRRQWTKFLDLHTELYDAKGERKTGRSLTMATNKWDGLDKLYRWDNRVAPWAGTAFGVVQAVNTWVHHEGIVKGASRAQRNADRAVTGAGAKMTEDTLATLDKALV